MHGYKSVKTLGEVGELKRGLVNLQFVDEVDRVMKDIIDRPGEGGARKVKIEITFKPDVDDSGTLEGISLSTGVSSSLPKSTVTGISIGRDREEGGMFQASQMRQTGLDEAGKQTPQNDGKRE